jgi:hypothetical protein
MVSNGLDLCSSLWYGFEWGLFFGVAVVCMPFVLCFENIWMEVWGEFI